MTNREKKKKKEKIQTPEEKIERDKIFLLGAGVCFFMSLIFVLWVFSLNDFWQKEGKVSDSESQDSLEESFTQWSTLEEQFNKDWGKVKQKIKEVSQEKTNERSLNERKNIEELKNNLESELENNNN